MKEYIIVNKKSGEVMEGVDNLSEAIEIRNQYNEMGKAWGTDYSGTYEIRERYY